MCGKSICHVLVCPFKGKLNIRWNPDPYLEG